MSAATRPRQLADLFPEVRDEWYIDEVVRNLGGHWTIELETGETFRADTLTPLGKRRSRRGEATFEVSALGYRRAGTPDGKLAVVRFDQIKSATRIVVAPVDLDKIAARRAARKADR